jgi:hypothetical protein
MKTQLKTNILIASLLLSTCVISAQQSSEKPVTVRVKKVTNINGVEKTSDSTYTIDGPFNVMLLDGITGEKTDLKTGKQKKTVIVTDEIHGDNLTALDQEEIDKQIEDALKAAGIDNKNYKVDKMVVIDDAAGEGSKTNIYANKIVVIKKIKIEDASSEDARTMEKQAGDVDQKLKLGQMTFYPNPNNGKFNLTFTLADKGNASITILNPEGKRIYNEELKDFTGTYDKEIDISSNPKGVYFVKIQQGEHAQLKKLMLD